MKKYMLVEDLYCRYFADTKKDIIDYVKHHYKNRKDYSGIIETLNDINVWSIKYNAKKIDIDNFFGDIIATDKKTDESIEYDDYGKNGIFDKEEKKDFLYYNI